MDPEKDAIHLFDAYVKVNKDVRVSTEESLKRLEDMGLISEVDGGAKLVGLEKQKLGKAIVRKKGTQPFFCISSFTTDCFSTRWNLYLSDSLAVRWSDMRNIRSTSLRPSICLSSSKSTTVSCKA